MSINLLQYGSRLRQRLGRVMERTHQIVDLIHPEQEIHLLDGTLQIPFAGHPIQVILGKQRQGPTLLIYPEGISFSQANIAPLSHLIVDPGSYGSKISGTLRLAAGDVIVLGRDCPEQQTFFNFSDDVAGQHLKISRIGDNFIFEDLTSTSGVYISTWQGVVALEALNQRRQATMARLMDYLGDPVQPLSSVEALTLIQQVNTLFDQDVFQPKDDRGRPGGVVLLPEKLIPIVIGDLHGQVSNLIKILIENAFLESLESGKAFLLFLGDFVHSEEEGKLTQMDSSLLMMDLIFKLKVRFPKQVFFLRGNHDSFADEVAKAGVCQGRFWKHAVLKSRGQSYKEAMEQFYDAIPYVAIGNQFLACHAAPPRGAITLEMLIELYKYPGLVKELIWNRLRMPGYPAGYKKSDVIRFRKSLQIQADTPFIVGHNPLSRDVPVWLDVGKIKNHHIVFSGLLDNIGLFTCVKGRLVPQVYLAEPNIESVLFC